MLISAELRAPCPWRSGSFPSRLPGSQEPRSRARGAGLGQRCRTTARAGAPEPGAVLAVLVFLGMVRAVVLQGFVR